MVMTREEFKALWDSSEDAGGITGEDVVDCYKDWGLEDAPYAQPGTGRFYLYIVVAVTRAAETKDAPMWQTTLRRHERDSKGQPNGND